MFTNAEKRHIQAHLALTELRLRTQSTDNQVTESKRATVLDILIEAIASGAANKEVVACEGFDIG